MDTHHSQVIFLATALVGFGGPAFAQPAPDESGHDESGHDESVPDESASARVPTVDHVPQNRARGGHPVTLKAHVAADWRLERLLLRARPVGEAAYSEFDFERDDTGDYRATVPAQIVGEPGFEYTIVSVARDGVARAHFASTDAPHRVAVEGRTDAQTQAQRLAGFGGNRSQFRLGGGATAYGPRPVGLATDGTGDGSSRSTDALSDRYWQVQAEYLYRPLGLIHDFRFGMGVMRAQMPTLDGAPLMKGETPGINYGYSEVTIEPHRWFTLGLRLLLGANEQGFVGGAGAVARLGSIERTHLAIGYEGIEDIGNRADVRFHWTTVERFPMALGIEFTDWPRGEDSPLGANLTYDLGYRFTNDFTLMARAGMANRSGSLEPGWQGGLELRYGF